MNFAEQQNRIDKSVATESILINQTQWWKQRSKSEDNMLRSITINLAGIKEAGFLDKTDLTDWAIIHYISHWLDYSNDIQVREGATYVWFSYRRLMREVPLLRLTTKVSVWARLKKLRELGLIDSFLDPGNKLYVTLTSKARLILGFSR